MAAVTSRTVLTVPLDNTVGQLANVPCDRWLSHGIDAKVGSARDSSIDRVVRRRWNSMSDSSLEGCMGVCRAKSSLSLAHDSLVRAACHSVRITLFNLLAHIHQFVQTSGVNLTGVR